MMHAMQLAGCILPSLREALKKIQGMFKAIAETFWQWSVRKDMESIHKAMWHLPDQTSLGMSPFNKPEIVTVSSNQPEVVALLLNVAAVAASLSGEEVQ